MGKIILKMMKIYHNQLASLKNIGSLLINVDLALRLPSFITEHDLGTSFLSSPLFGRFA